MARFLIFCMVLSLASGALAAAPAKTAPVKHITLHKDTVAIGLHGGAAVPLGDSSKFNNAGAAAGLDINFKAAHNFSMDIYLDYGALPYKLSTAAQAFSCTGLGIRAEYTLFELEGVRPFVRGGLGYYFASRATQVYKSTDPVTGLPITETKYRSDTGLGFTGGLGGAYAVTPSFEVLVALDVTSVSLAGGTGDSILFASPTLGFAYTF